MSTPASLKRIEDMKRRSTDRGGYERDRRGGGGYRDDYRDNRSRGFPQPFPERTPYNFNPGFVDFADDNFALRNSGPPMQLSNPNQGPFYQGGMGGAFADIQPLSGGGLRGGPDTSNLLRMPLNTDPVPYVIAPDNITCFHGKRHFLSTLKPCRFRIEGFEYPSVEHYYQACKLYTLGGSHLAVHMSRIQDPSLCKNKARELLQGVDKRMVETWKVREAPEILLHAMLHKFSQNPVELQQLLATNDSLLLHTFDKDTTYATGMNEADTKKWVADNKGKTIKIPRNFEKSTFEDTRGLPNVGKGKNVLGILAMIVREAFRPERERADPRVVQMLQGARAGASRF